MARSSGAGTFVVATNSRPACSTRIVAISSRRLTRMIAVSFPVSRRHGDPPARNPRTDVTVAPRTPSAQAINRGSTSGIERIVRNRCWVDRQSWAVASSSTRSSG